MYRTKAIIIYLLVALFPVMFAYLTFGGILRIATILALSLATLFMTVFSDKIILLFLGAREITDFDQHDFFQILKTEVYKELEDLPAVYLYNGIEMKPFVFSLRNSWSIVLDRQLIERLDLNQTKALIKFLINNKKKSACKSQTIGMGVTSALIFFTYSFWKKISFGKENTFFKAGIFMSFIMIKPLVEFILKLSTNNEDIICEPELKPVYMLITKDSYQKSFFEFMLNHLEADHKLSLGLVGYLESFPLLENCKFNEGHNEY